MIKHGKRGDPITAEKWNQIIDVARRAESIRGGKGVNIHSGPSGSTISESNPITRTRDAIICKANNAGDTALGVQQPAVVVGQIYAADSNDIHNRTVLDVRAADAEEDDETAVWVVPIDSIQPGQIGRVCVMGVCLAQVKAEDAEAEGTFAELKPEVSTMELIVSESGQASLLWHDETGDITEPHLGLIRFPVGGGISIPIVKDLPPIPDAPGFVYWTEEDGGNGDNQVWQSGPGRQDWIPISGFSLLSGVPIE